MEIIHDNNINIAKCIYFEKKYLFADIKPIFWVNIVDRGPYFMQALSPDCQETNRLGPREVKARMCPPYPQRVVKGDLRGGVSIGITV